jgi:hypothetical protein
MQSWWDPHHLLIYGLLKKVIDHCFGTLTGAHREIFRIRIRDFKWPSSAPKLTIDFKQKLGISTSMTQWRQLGLVAFMAFDGILDAARYKFYILVFRFVIMSFRPLNTRMLTDLQLRCETIITLSKRANIMNNKLDLTTGHGIIEFTRCTLPALMNANFASTTDFEAHHKVL